MQQNYQPPFHQQLIQEIDNTYTHAQFIKLLDNPTFNYGLGCIFGACVGDALGSYCEFARNQIDNEMMDKAMNMEGGGPFATYPGQLTDDSELAMHLIQGLNTYNKNIKLEDQINQIIIAIAKQYVKWLYSQPFDIGNTCSSAFSALSKSKLENIQPNKSNQQLQLKVNLIFTEIEARNNKSQSNGSLMRITPMAFFVSSFHNSKTVQQLVQKQIKLTHSNNVSIISGLVWVKLLVKLINRKSNEKKQLLEIRQEILEMGKGTLDDWINQSNEQKLMPAISNMGWSKIAWSMGFNILKKIGQQGVNQNTYSNHIRHVISCAGDTDTNAAIVGGMIGGIVGFKGIPPQYISKAVNLKFKTQNQRNDRSSFYQPRNMLIKAINLFKKTH